MVVGSDTPRFVLYDDGLAIWKTDAGYASATLTRSDAQALLASMDADSLAGLERSYVAARATDQPTSFLLVHRGGALLTTSVYGDLEHKSTRAVVPAPVVAAFDRLIGFDHPAAASWLPEKVEVMIWPYEYAPDPSTQWPADWPDLKAADTVDRGEESYSLFVPAADLPRLQALLASMKPKGAMQINGRKWAVSIRYPFPAEDRWMGGE